MENKNDNLKTLRHSAEHILTQAMESLYPKILKAMGPATEDGFYFDVDLNGVEISEKDFSKIEKEMQKIIKENLPITRKEVSVEEAKKLFKDNPYKQEWLGEIEAKSEKPTVYWTGNDFVDLCEGPHVKSTGEIKAFKLLSIAGAYWHGDEKNKMLSRIYGTAFPTQKELDEYLKKLEEIKMNDHRKLGSELNLFIFAEEVGRGLPLFTEKGTTIIRELENFVIKEEIKRGYKHVNTPDLAKIKLYEISGHYPYYKNTMYPVMKVDDDELVLRPMTCPHHFMLYKSQIRSYKDLPLRIAEIGKLYRYEKSGELTGLIRLRGFCLADSHIFVNEKGALEEIKNVIDLIDYAVGVLGFEKGKDYFYRLSLGNADNKEKYFQDPKNWKKGESVLRQVLNEINAPYYEAKDEAAFYGPKIDIQMKNILGKEETAFTVQYDLCLPKRFELKFINEKGKEEQPVVIHRSSIGAIERTLAFLIEKYAGAFPVWLSPVQVQIIPISEKHFDYAKKLERDFNLANIRVQSDLRNETMQAKIRDAQIQKIPYMVIAGDRELKEKTISVRFRDGRNTNGIRFEDFIEKVKKTINDKSLKL